MQKKAFILSIALLLLCGHAAYAQKDSTRKKKRLSVFPVPAIGYAPETRWFVGAVALFNLKFLQVDSTSRVSTAKTEINITQNKQLIIDLEWNIFSKHTTWFHEGTLNYRKFPELYWGVGGNTPDSTKELYSAYRIEADISSLKRIGNSRFVGLRFRYQNMYGVSPKQGGMLENVPVHGATGAISSGIGPAYLYDSRLNSLNPQQGAYLSASTLYFGKTFGGNAEFSRFEADARKYFKIKNTILALQAYGILQGGNPPFRMMGLMGSERDMRGYYQGRYRDNNYVSFQAEWRVPVKWGIGFAVFAGAGEVYNWNTAYNMQVFKYTTGGGLRIAMDKEKSVNLRIDYAVGHNTSGFYIAFGEAF
jgi:outer membrane protein assembly factor BamA